MAELTPAVAAVLRRLRAGWLMRKAKRRKQIFLCAALAGRSQVNLSINSDLTVSCSCHDVDGSGHLGDLGRQSLQEILSGPIAQRFRNELADGRLPTPLCARCCDLHSGPRDRLDRMARAFGLPSFIMVENTSACNLRCGGCPRRQIQRLRTRLSMSLDDVRHVAREIKETGIEAIGYLNYGEPFLSRTIRRELEILREANPGLFIGTSTNGMLIDCDEKRAAAMLLDRIQVSLDGVDQRSAARYQRGIDFQRALENLQALVAYRDARQPRRPTIIWKYLLFRWNDHPRQLEQAIALARQSGVDEILFEKTVSPVDGISWRWYLGRIKVPGERSEDGIRLPLREIEEPLCAASP